MRSLLVVTAIVWAGCGHDLETSAGSSSAAASAEDGGVPSGCAPIPPATKPAASCDVSILFPPVPGDASVHVPEGTDVTYCTNPPAAGRHYPVWADFREYTKEIPKSYLVHDLEHGAVELFYNCPTGCDDVVKTLEAVRDAEPEDPLCTPFGEKSRIIIAPNSAIPTKVAAAAWRSVLTADCADQAVLTQFVKDNYGKGPELLCVPGRAF